MKTSYHKLKNFINTPFGVILLVAAVVFGVEVLVMEFLFVFVPVIQASVPPIAFNFLDAVILTLAVSPALYFLIYQRIHADAEKLRKITESAQDAIIVMDNHGRVSFWNEAAETIFGYTKTEAIGKELHKLIAPEKSLNAFNHNFKGFQETGEGPILESVREVMALRKGGEEFPAELAVSALPINGTWHSVGIVRDITARKKRENLLRERERELTEVNEYLRNKEAKEQALLASLGEGMISTEIGGEIITINRVAEEMLGWKEAELVGKKLIEAIPAISETGNIIPPENRVCLNVTAGACVGPLTDDTSAFVKKNGESVPVAITTTPVIIGGKCSGAVIIFRDITNEKELEKTRRDLLSLASHQLRTPLSGTKWLIETLQREIHGTLTEKQGEYLTQIYKINERMTNLVHDMLGVLRMEGDINPAKIEPVSIQTLFGVITETLGNVAKEKNITLEISKTAESSIDTDSLLLRNILECLISNAINYSNEGGAVLVETKRDGADIVFSVKDSGIGIPADEQRQIFQRFYRATNAKTFDTKGTGLGLYIAATLAKKIGAKLTFESAEDAGTTFFLRLPASAK
ncbi:MAG: PAS domain S-box protein [Candidatus Pacebacteria bacterium]|jgi:PAS domain S-box-containing protein|nr:PAS domain S-box protein [Candidatus Paceibacterota bacterium]